MEVCILPLVCSLHIILSLRFNPSLHSLFYIYSCSLLVGLLFKMTLKGTFLCDHTSDKERCEVVMQAVSVK